MHISRLHLRNFRNFRNAAFCFEKGVNTLIGENGSGKTNAFHAIRLLLDDSLARGAIRLRESDFNRSLANWKGHWIVISMGFAELDASEGCQILRHHVGHMDASSEGTFTYLFRPNKAIRKGLYELTHAEEPEAARRRFLEEITIDQYEPVLTGRAGARFLDDDVYARLAGDFSTLSFPDPDDEDAALVGDRVLQPLHQEVSCTFVKALRDVLAELRNYRDSPLLNLLRGTERRIQVGDSERILQKIAEINTDISSLDEIRQISRGVQSTLHDTVGHTYSPAIDIRSSIPEELERLLQRLSLTVSDPGDDGYKGELDELSLGGANLIYLSLKLLEYELKTATDRVAHFLLVEEPESHIHTHIQKTLFEKYSYDNTQVIVSTHSTHISAASRVRSVNILARGSREACVFHPANELVPEQCRRVERYLDAVRSTLLFAKAVVLVEGDAELVLIPALVKKLFGISLDEMGISLVSMSAAVFTNVATLFHDSRIRRRCAILTDLDKSLLPLSDDAKDDDEAHARCRASELSGAARRDRLNDMCAENQWLAPFYATHTFEVDFLLAGNKEIVVDALPSIYTSASAIGSSATKLRSSDVAVAGTEILRLAAKEGKGWFAVLLAEHLTADARLPAYVIEALAFAGKTSVDRRTLCQMVRHRSEECLPPGAIREDLLRALQSGDSEGILTLFGANCRDDQLARLLALMV